MRISENERNQLIVKSEISETRGARSTRFPFLHPNVLSIRQLELHSHLSCNVDFLSVDSTVGFVLDAASDCPREHKTGYHRFLRVLVDFENYSTPKEG